MRNESGLMLEEKFIDGVLHMRVNGDKDFFPVDLDTLTNWYKQEQELVQYWHNKWKESQEELRAAREAYFMEVTGLNAHA